MRERIDHCPGCGFVAKFATPPKEGEREAWKLEAQEKLRALGYVR